MTEDEYRSISELVETATDMAWKGGCGHETFDESELRKAKDKIVFFSTTEEKRLALALRTIAAFPVTDPKANQDAYNMGKIAREALGMAEDP